LSKSKVLGHITESNINTGQDNETVTKYHLVLNSATDITGVLYVNL